MNTSVPVSADNVYKFLCTLGCAMMLLAAYASFNVYTTSLSEKEKYQESIYLFQGKTADGKGQLNDAETHLLALDKKLLELTTENEKTYIQWLGYLIGAGLVAAVLGGWSWHYRIQKRDDRIGNLQEDKLRKEIDKLDVEIETAKKKLDPSNEVEAE